MRKGQMQGVGKADSVRQAAFLAERFGVTISTLQERAEVPFFLIPSCSSIFGITAPCCVLIGWMPTWVGANGMAHFYSLNYLAFSDFFGIQMAFSSTYLL